jgi:hypothetical protein
MTGRPPTYSSVEEIDKAIQDYFENGIKIKTVVIGKAPNQTAIEVPVPTITGLVLHLGFESRQSFYDYEEKPEFSYTIKRARTLIEKEYEEMLQIGNTTGAIFALKNMGWKDKSEVEQSGQLVLNWHEEKTYITK